MARLNRKVSASTLLEVIISLVIIMAVFTAAIAIYAKISTSELSLSRRQAQQQMQEMIQEVKEKKDWENETLQVKDIIYEKEITAYADYSDLYQVKIKAFQNEKLISSMKEVIKKTSYAD